MVTKDAKNVFKKADYLQRDNKILQILKREGVEIFPIVKAFEKFSFVRKFFEKKPKSGYFVWVKKTSEIPLRACVLLGSFSFKQELENLLILEKGVFAKAHVLCAAEKENLCAKHLAKGKIVLKENSKLEYLHLHSFGKKDFVFPNYEIFLKKNSQLFYYYKCLKSPKNLEIQNKFYLKKLAKAKINFVLKAENCVSRTKEAIFLEGENSQAVLRMRVLTKKSKFLGENFIFAKTLAIGHLDCQGLILDKKSQISFLPGLNCEHNKAQLSHEAAVGKISEDQIFYLRTRGFSQKEAVDLICSGFLNL